MAKKGAAALTNLATPSFWADRLSLFDRLYEAQKAKYAECSRPIRVTLPDGTVVDAHSFQTTPWDIAKSISASLAERSIVARVGDVLWDMTRPLESDCALELLDWDDAEAQHVFWHSSAHVLGYALERVFSCRLSVGPPLDDGGFFYEGDTGRPVTDADYAAIEAAMGELVKKAMPYQRLVLTKDEALRMFGYSEFKHSILAKKVPEGGTCTVYRCGELIDPCRGPHLIDTGRVRAFAVTKNSSSYFGGDANNAALQRVYGIAFPKEAMLKQWKTLQVEAAKRDHRIIGKQQELFYFHDVSPGSAFFAPHGARIYNALIEFQRRQYRMRGFEEVISPNIYNSKLWMVSGHWKHYKDAMFATVCEKEAYALKPMNCPGHCLLFAMRPHSYRELPIRFADFGVLHRNELSGALTGLTRVRRFQQDDAHIFCRLDQLEQEIDGALTFLKDVYSVLGFSFYLRLSTRPTAFVGDVLSWNRAEEQLARSLNKFCGLQDDLPHPLRAGQTFKFDGRPATIKLLRAAARKAGEGVALWTHAPWELKEGDGAFYGPKIDIEVGDALHRRHQCATIQLDFNLPYRFGLKYTLPTADGQLSDKQTLVPHAAPVTDGDEDLKALHIDRHLDANQERPVMIHRAIFGSLERCIAILCEHYSGKWPFWLSPRQAVILPVSEAYTEYCQAVRNTLHADGFYVDLDTSAATLDKKIRNAQVAQYNFILVAGAEEQAAGSVNIRTRDNQRHGAKPLAEVVAWFHSLRNSYSADY